MLRGEILPEVTPENVTIMGDSAGGNLAAAVCLMARDKKELLPGKQILIYPAVNSCYTEKSPYKSVKMCIRDRRQSGLSADKPDPLYLDRRCFRKRSDISIKNRTGIPV